MTEVLDPPLTEPVTHALDSLEAAMDELADTIDSQMLAMTAEQLTEATAAVHRLRTRTDAVLHSLVREVDARGVARELGASGTAAWLRSRLRVHPGTAKRLVETSRALLDDPRGPLVHHAGPDEAAEMMRGPAMLRAAFGQGLVNAEQVSVACDALADVVALPIDLTDEVASDAEAFLVEQALIHDPKALGRLGKRLLHALDPSAGEALELAEEHAVGVQRLELRDRRDGWTDVSGRLGPELTAALRAHLGPLTAPRAEQDGVKDRRTLGQRQADALHELLRRYSKAQLGPTVHGAATTVTVTTSLETLERRLGSSGGWLDWVGPISASTARRLACDAKVIPVVLAANGEPLDVGRASYEVTQAIWRGLVARDGGCAFAGCDRPPDWCEAHHRVHWVDGGPTNVENCCLLCDFHHRAVHHHGWRVELVDGAIWTVPPPWVDPLQEPRRNTQRNRLLDPDGLDRVVRKLWPKKVQPPGCGREPPDHA